MRCAAAAFLGSSSGKAEDTGRRSSDAWASATPITSSAAVNGCRSPFSPHRRSHSGKRTFQLSPTQAEGHSVVENCEGSGKGEGVTGLGNGNRIPRPVTARQLYSAVLGVSPAALSSVDDSDNTQHSRLNTTTPAAAISRVGESTILVDGVACHVVAVCGRVVRFDTAVPDARPRGGLADARLFDRVWITDSTGLLCLLRPHHRPSQRLSCVEPLLSMAEVAQMVPRKECSSDAAASGCAGNADEQAPSVFSCKSGCVGQLCGVEGRNAAAPLPSTPTVPDALFAASTATSFPATQTAVAAEDDSALLEEQEADVFYFGDYVVCVGVLCFADVDRSVAAVLSSDVELLRRAACAAVAPRISSSLPPHLCRGGKANTDGEHTHVLLPGGAVPLRVDAAAAAFGIVGDFPPQTRYLTEQEALEWEEGVADVAHDAAGRERDSGDVRSVSPPSPSTRAVASQPQPVTDSFPLFCVRGRPRLLLDSNESLFWWLSAVETHLRLTRTKTR